MKADGAGTVIGSLAEQSIAMDRARRCEIETLLKADLEKAREVQILATARFHQIASEIPSNIPHPDGSLRIQQTGIAARQSLTNYVLALKRYTDFVASGTLPEDIVLTPRAIPPKRYCVLYPIRVVFQDLTHGFIRPNSIVTVKGTSAKDGETINVSWENKHGKVAESDLYQYAKLEPEP